MQLSWEFGRSVQPAAPKRQFEAILALNSDESRADSAEEKQDVLEARIIANF